MGIFDKVREAFRDKTREWFCAELQALGIDAQIAERGRAEEEIVGKVSHGLINIPKGPIRWVNLCKEIRVAGESSATVHFTEYGVPDSRLGQGFPSILIESVCKKTFPLVGDVVDLHWKGNDSGLGIIERLKNDTVIKRPIMESRDVAIHAYGDHGCWTIETQTENPPWGEMWNCYQAIAKHLLAEWPDQDVKWHCARCGSEISEVDKVCPSCEVELEKD